MKGESKVAPSTRKARRGSILTLVVVFQLHKMSREQEDSKYLRSTLLHCSVLLEASIFGFFNKGRAHLPLYTQLAVCKRSRELRKCLAKANHRS